MIYADRGNKHANIVDSSGRDYYHYCLLILNSLMRRLYEQNTWTLDNNTGKTQPIDDDCGISIMWTMRQLCKPRKREINDTIAFVRKMNRNGCRNTERWNQLIRYFLLYRLLISLSSKVFPYRLYSNLVVLPDIFWSFQNFEFSQRSHISLELE